MMEHRIPLCLIARNFTVIDSHIYLSTGIALKCYSECPICYYFKMCLLCFTCYFNFRRRERVESITPSTSVSDPETLQQTQTEEHYATNIQEVVAEQLDDFLQPVSFVFASFLYTILFRPTCTCLLLCGNCGQN